jgi:hypothetical protein
MVLLSVDGTGHWTTYYPATGSTPARVAPRPQELPESIQLDAAPGPEVFVTFFGVTTVEEAMTMAESAYRNGGIDGLQDLARERDDIEVSVIRRRMVSTFARSRRLRPARSVRRFALLVGNDEGGPRRRSLWPRRTRRRSIARSRRSATSTNPTRALASRNEVLNAFGSGAPT